MNSIDTFDFRVAGIPCKIAVSEFTVVAPHCGSPHTCDSDMDFYGYEEIEFAVLDTRGRPALWLESKIDENERERIENEIFKRQQNNRIRSKPFSRCG